MARHNEIGKIGEDIATQFLKDKGFEILERNFRKPYGEIDIVTRKNGVVHFIEVKSVSWETVTDYIPRETIIGNGTKKDSVSHETILRQSMAIRPEENLHPEKIKRLKRVIQVYIFSHETGDWVFDLILVYIDEKKHTAKVKLLKDIIL